MSNPTFDVFVVGSGVAGLAAAELALRRGLTVCVAEESVFGGLVLNVNHLQPGLDGMPASGADLASELMSRAADLGAEMLFEPVTGIEPAAGGTLRVATASETRNARCVVAASGARLRRLGVPGEAEFDGQGVSHCADCDAPMLGGKTAVAVGGGDSALQETLVLAEFCASVHLVHRGSSFRGRAELAQAVQAAPNVQVHFDTVVEAVVGTTAVTAVRVRTAGQAREIPCEAVFAYVGLEPNMDWLPAAVARSDAGVQVDAHLETTLPGVFAIGALRQGHGGRLTDALRDAQAVVETLAVRLAHP